MSWALEPCDGFLDRAEGEPARRRILELLRDGPRVVAELVELVGLSQPNTSKHLCVLRESGLVGVRRDGQRRWYELRPEPLAEVDAWLQLTASSRPTGSMRSSVTSTRRRRDDHARDRHGAGPSPRRARRPRLVFD